MHDLDSLNNALIAGALLFALGVIGFVSRRDPAVSLISAGIMLQGILVTLSGYSRFHGSVSGQVFALFLVVSSIIEVAVAVAMAVRIRRDRQEVSATTSAQISVGHEPSPSSAPAEDSEE